jgi:hypothetical protein
VSPTTTIAAAKIIHAVMSLGEVML